MSKCTEMSILHAQYKTLTRKVYELFINNVFEPCDQIKIHKKEKHYCQNRKADLSTDKNWKQMLLVASEKCTKLSGSINLIETKFHESEVGLLLVSIQN